MRDAMRVLDIAPHRHQRQAFADRFKEDGHDIVTVPGRREALEMISSGAFDLAVLDASSDLYDTKALVEEIRNETAKDTMIAVFVEPRNRPPRHKITGQTPNVVVLQDGSVDHMTRMVHLAFDVREHEVKQGAAAVAEAMARTQAKADAKAERQAQAKAKAEAKRKTKRKAKAR
jgi:DNA-binding NtrC family response regulator